MKRFSVFVAVIIIFTSPRVIKAACYTCSCFAPPLSILWGETESEREGSPSFLLRRVVFQREGRTTIQGGIERSSCKILGGSGSRAPE